MGLNLLSPVLNIYKDKHTLIKTRIFMYTLNLTHTVFVFFFLLNIDLSQHVDPEIRSYANERKWKLLTAWTNLLHIVYLQVSIYCDYRELNGQTNNKQVVVLNKIRHFCFTSILMPSIFFADIAFWRLWFIDKSLIASLELLNSIVPLWTQHSMHTVPLVAVMLDLILVPRKRPKNLAPGFYSLIIFLTVYFLMCVLSAFNGDYAYPFIKRFSTTKFTLLLIYGYVENLFFFTVQWFFIDWFWGKVYR